MIIKYNQGCCVTVVGTENIADVLDLNNKQKKALQKLQELDWADLYAVVSSNGKGAIDVIFYSDDLSKKIGTVSLNVSSIKWRKYLEKINTQWIAKLTRQITNLEKTISVISKLDEVLK